jgi:LmbE family N-acetylglucosaminyl deacetylase
MVTAVGHGAWLKLRHDAQRLDERKLIALSPILVVSPHQDDETLGCGGLLAMASRLGLRPRVAYLTDGSASHLDSATWPPDRLARTRRLEALSALAILGVGADDVHFLGWPDAAPLAPGQPAYGRSLDRLADWAAAFAPASLWSPWRGERHCDHVAAADLALDLSRRLHPSPARMDYLVWGWTEAALARAPAAAWALDCPDTTEARRRALACHRTQLDGVIVDARTSFQIPPELAALTARPTEIYLEGA